MIREKQNMNKNWRFHLGEIPLDTPLGHYASYMHAKAQSGRNVQKELYYDEHFITVDLPHDYVISQTPSGEYNESNGGYPRENAWYRRYFFVPEADRGKRLVLLFEGAGQHTEVWVNGHRAGSNESMYNSFYIDISPYLNYNDTNVVAVHIRNDNDLEGWWYEGAGIYRNVWLIKTAPVAVDVWGIGVLPEKVNEKTWNVPVDIRVYNSNAPCCVEICCTLKDTAHQDVAGRSTTAYLLFGENAIHVDMTIDNPLLWDISEPNLYTIEADIIVDGQLYDHYEDTFGFRTIQFHSENGFFLNNRHLKLRGVCMHQDHGRLGVAVPESVMEFRIQTLKSVGVNAYRCAHHNPSPYILELCDRYGLLVIDENRWFNFSEQTKKQLDAMCLRDRNHPSVIVWSVGNEEPLQSSLVGKELTRQLREYVHRHDRTRPVTIALNGGFFDSYASEESDVIAVNYQVDNYEKMHRVHPKKCLVATESAASNNNRGVYCWNIDYANCSAPELAPAYDAKRSSFGSSYGHAIEASESKRFVAGTFLWAGMEYRGEAQWPVKICASGIFDNCGIPKDTAYAVKSMWTSEPMVYMLPHWNFPGMENKEVPIHVYTNLAQVELFVNGKSQGVKKVVPFAPVKYMVSYVPGIIEAVATDHLGNRVTHRTATTGMPVKLLTIVENTISNCGEDAAVISVKVVDEKGQIVPDATNLIDCQVVHGGQLLMIDNGDPMDDTSSPTEGKRLFSGQGQVIIRMEEGAEKLVCSISCPSIGDTQQLRILPKTDCRIPRVPVCAGNLALKEFRRWPNTDNDGACDLDYNFDDMNTSEPIILQDYSEDCGEEYAVFTGKTVIPEIPMNKKLGFLLQSISGDVEIRIFHDHNCWPNPTPKKFLDIRHHLVNERPEDYRVDLKGFSSGEKINMIICARPSNKFAIKQIVYITDE